MIFANNFYTIVVKLTKINTMTTSFEDSVYKEILKISSEIAIKAFDIQQFRKQFAKEFKTKPHPGLFLELKSDKLHFPHTLVITSKVNNKNANSINSFYLEFDLTRPDYEKHSAFGQQIRGNNVIVALLNEIKKEIKQIAEPLSIEIFTGKNSWNQFVNSTQYISLMEQRLFNKQIPSPSKKDSETKPTKKIAL